MLVPPKNQPEADIVYTPPELAKRIIDYINPTGSYMDPCKGGGAFYDNVNLEDKTYCELAEGIDYLSCTAKTNWVISNPPWSKLREFLIHSMKHSNNIAYLATVTHFVTKARLRDIREHGFYINEFILHDRPITFPQSGFQVCTAVLSKNKTDTKWSYL